ncbi:piggyBac transposable element-derived protein 3-like [Dermacentor andersoni]|uniref:piggyBac transposable element-derived protein 3-like n=1 Tax=Dermacentor andersoni TaxID=34620 RepID=UPI00215578D3|nr:piggyBac transposable element-derived protein 3-like [Dermacentor andersoni]
MAARSSSGMAIPARTFYGRSSKNKAPRVKDIIACMPSGDDSDFGDLTDDDEYTPDSAPRLATDDTDTSDQSSEEDEDDVGSSHCGTGSVDRGHWRKRLMDHCIPAFTDTSTQPSEVRSFMSYFRQFVTPSMMNAVVRETNLYSTQTTGKSLDVTESELEQFVGLNLLMGLVQMPSVRSYWEHATRFAPIADIMPRNRFEKIVRLLHFTDNNEASDEAKRDKVWKIRPWLDELQRNFLTVEPEELNSVDEIMISFTGRCPIKQYMPAKPHPWGIKLWARASSSGFLYQFDVYQGQAKMNYQYGLGGDVTLKMCQALPENKGYKVAADNYFSSLDLAAELSKRGLGFVGTLRSNRLKDCRLKSESDLKKEGRGAFDYAVDSSRNIAVVRWHDNRAVTIVSNYISTEPVGSVRRWDRKEKKYIHVPQPAAIKVYNSFMGGVDLLNYLVELYKFGIKSRRWYIYLFYHTLMMSTVNAWLLYRRHCDSLNQKNVNLRHFQAGIAQCLIAVGKKPVGRPSSFGIRASIKRKVSASSPDDEVRRDGVSHMPVWGTNRLRCRHCPPGKNFFSFIYCGKCNVQLCLNKDRNCFAAYHM